MLDDTKTIKFENAVLDLETKKVSPCSDTRQVNGDYSRLDFLNDELSAVKSLSSSQEWNCIIVKADGEDFLKIKNGHLIEVHLHHINEMRSGAFEGYSALEKVVLPEGLEEIGCKVFHGCASLQEIKIPEGVKKIKASAFRLCSSLEKVVIPSAVKEIEWHGFYECSALKEVVFAEGLEKIGSCAFQGCSALKEVVIPATVTKIGDCAFKNCPNLKIACATEEQAALVKESGFTGVIKITGEIKIDPRCVAQQQEDKGNMHSR